jgi:putative peptidoglycan lipid II flippase
MLPKFRGALLDSGALKREYGYLAVNNAVAGGAFFVNQSMAAMLGPGNISIFNFGTRFAAVLMAIGPAALSVTVLPRFSELVAERNWKGLKHMSRTLLLGWMSATATATVLLIAFSEPIVRYALQRGAFTAADAAAVTLVQSYSLLQLPFAFGIAVLTRLLVSLQANAVLIPFSLAALLMNAGLNTLLMKELGVSGIALSASVVQAVLFLALLGIVSYGARKRFLKESSS